MPQRLQFNGHHQLDVRRGLSFSPSTIRAISPEHQVVPGGLLRHRLGFSRFVRPCLVTLPGVCLGGGAQALLGGLSNFQYHLHRQHADDHRSGNQLYLPYQHYSHFDNQIARRHFTLRSGDDKGNKGDGPADSTAW